MATKGAAAGMPADGRMLPDVSDFNADKGVSLEEFFYYAKEQRRAERAGLDYRTSKATFADFAIGSRPVEHPHHQAHAHEGVQKTDDALLEKKGDHGGDMDVTDAQPTISPVQLERINARRALRVASWGAAFFLITTDILGPFNAPYAIQQVGLVPGALLYFFMGIAASFTGYCIQLLFCGLDSERYPVTCYATLANRIFGRWAYWGITRGIYLVLNVGVICLSNGQGLEQIIQGPNGTGSLCFVVTILISAALIGMVLGQIRGLRNYSFLSSTAVFQNVIICIIVIAFAARSNPNYGAANAAYGIDAGPVVTQTFTSNDIPTQVNGVMNMVFAYGGAQIFPEILAEMRRPFDFWKGLAIAQLLFICVYMVFGEVVYALQGQFTLALAYQGIGPYSGQTVCNVFALITGLLAAGLYGNIGAKVVYINVVEGLFKGPPLMSKRGRMIWSPMIILYWSIAFVLGTGIPQVGAFTGLIGAVAIVPLTYAFPLTLICAFFVHKSAMRGDGGFQPGMAPQRVDSWRQASRWKRGFFGGSKFEVMGKFALLVLALAAYAMTGLGIYGTSLSLAAAFQASSATSFGCSPPV